MTCWKCLIAKALVGIALIAIAEMHAQFAGKPNGAIAMPAPAVGAPAQ